MRYKQIAASDFPGHVRFDIPAPNQGQAVEISYADWPLRRWPAEEGALYKRVIDRSLPVEDPERVTYYRRVVES